MEPDPRASILKSFGFLLALASVYKTNSNRFSKLNKIFGKLRRKKKKTSAAFHNILCWNKQRNKKGTLCGGRGLISASKSASRWWREGWRRNRSLSQWRQQEKKALMKSNIIKRRAKPKGNPMEGRDEDSSSAMISFLRSISS